MISKVNMNVDIGKVFIGKTATILYKALVEQKIWKYFSI